MASVMPMMAEVPQPAVNRDRTLCEVAAGNVRNCAVWRYCSPHVRLHFPAKVENHDRDAVVHPEQAEEHVIPTRNLAGAATAGAVAREPEAQVAFVRNQARTACKQHAKSEERVSR